MPRGLSGTSHLWNFPGGISDWLTKGWNILGQIRGFNGQPYDDRTQISFMRLLRAAHLTAANPNAIQGRKILNSFAKVGLMDTAGRINLTQRGTDFLSATTIGAKKLVLRRACESIEFWNPVETGLARDFDIRPYAATLYALLRLGYLSNREIEKHVIKIKKRVQVDAAIQNIERDRVSSATYSPSIDERNRAQWMMSLFGGTDLIEHRAGKISLNASGIDDAINIVRSEFPNVAVAVEKEVDAEIKQETAPMPAADLDRRLAELLARKSNEIRSPMRSRRQTNPYKRKAALAALIKRLYDFKCQICGTQLKKRGWAGGMSRKTEWEHLYAETSHIKDVAHHPEYDVKENMLCLCPNCHKNIDNGVYEISKPTSSFVCRDLISGTTYTMIAKPEHGLTLLP